MGFLTGVDAEGVRAFYDHAQRFRFPSHYLLFAQNEAHECTYLIEEGLVRVFYLAPTGKAFTLAFWSAGNLVGGPNVFGGCRHTWGAEVTVPSRLWSIKGEDLRQATIRSPILAQRILDGVAFKLQWLSIGVQNLATESVDTRLARLLLNLSELYGLPTRDGTMIRYLFRHEDLATMIGASRQWVTRAINALTQAGIIRHEGAHYVVLQPHMLRDECAEMPRTHPGPDD